MVLGETVADLRGKSLPPPPQWVQNKPPSTEASANGPHNDGTSLEHAATPTAVGLNDSCLLILHWGGGVCELPLGTHRGEARSTLAHSMLGKSSASLPL